MFVINNREDLKEFIKADITREEKAYKTPPTGRVHRPSFAKGYINGMKNCLMFIESWEKQHPKG